jgi:hypothetical protein
MLLVYAGVGKRAGYNQDEYCARGLINPSSNLNAWGSVKFEETVLGDTLKESEPPGLFYHFHGAYSEIHSILIIESFQVL